MRSCSHTTGASRGTAARRSCRYSTGLRTAPCLPIFWLRLRWSDDGEDTSRRRCAHACSACRTARQAAVHPAPSKYTHQKCIGLLHNMCTFRVRHGLARLGCAFAAWLATWQQSAKCNGRQVSRWGGQYSYAHQYAPAWGDQRAPVYTLLLDAEQCSNYRLVAAASCRCAGSARVHSRLSAHRTCAFNSSVQEIKQGDSVSLWHIKYKHVGVC